MSHRAAASLAWGLWAFSVVLMVAQATLSLLDLGSQPTGGPPTWIGILVYAGILGYPTVGALVASRRPRNAVGWLLCALGLMATLGFFANAYAHYGQGTPQGSLEGAGVARYFDTINPSVLLVTFVLLLFPDGHVPSRRWRPVGWVCGAGIAAYVAYETLRPGSPNPLGGTLAGSSVHAAYIVEQAIILCGLVGAVVSLVVRLLRARGDERQQIKWLVYIASITVVGALLLPLSDAFWLVVLLSICAMPLAVGIAILRYRLYDIDILINRTLVYGSLTAILAGVYFGGVTATQALFRTLTGQEKSPQLVVVASTLVIAALFNPLRRRIQSFIDRRFYRSKYDAQKTLEAFSATLREETDLGALSENLVGVVRETMQPAHVSLWLRPDKASKGELTD
jgi:hypothetical protein